MPRLAARVFSRASVHASVLLVATLVGCSDSGGGFMVADPDGGAAEDLAGRDLAGRDLATGQDPGHGSEGPWPAEWNTLEEEVLAETNRRRAAGADCRTKGRFGAAGALALHPALRTAARLHSKDMGTNNYFNHQSQDGRSPFDRMRTAGFSGGTMGENIAAGNDTAAATVDQWMKSDGHCANIMNKAYRYLGVGYFPAPASRFRHYWTQNFGG